jgi:nitroreductase
MEDPRLESIFRRRSIRKYTDKPVSEQDIERLLKATMSAPSASNRQPWQFIVVTDRQKLDALAEFHPYGKMLFEAPLCIVVCGELETSATSWEQDCSLASENLLLAVTALGLGAVYIGIHPRQEWIDFVRKAFKIPDNIVPLNLISIGHPAETKEPRTQYSKARVHNDRW